MAQLIVVAIQLAQLQSMGVKLGRHILREKAQGDAMSDEMIEALGQFVTSGRGGIRDVRNDPCRC